ncbi:MAG: MarR family transcriptional regulator [Caulobacteraceae bacterium]|nr:MarR family transcriptional regulator [Caulobacteraceae bacterium]
MPLPEQLRLDRQLCLSLYSATNALIRAYGPFLKPLGLTYPQYLVMMALWEAGPLTVSDICDKTRLETGTVTPLLKRLEAKGLLQRNRSLVDERAREIVLTEAGRRLREPAAEVPIQMACLSFLTPEQGGQIKALSETLFDNLKRHEDRVDPV